MRDNSERVLDMLEAIENIERYSKKGPHVFKSDELIQAWVVYHLQIIGEAASKWAMFFMIPTRKSRGLKLLPCEICSLTNTLGLTSTRYGR